MINFKNGNWYYSDGTTIKFAYHIAQPVWKSHDGIIRLIDYDDKSDTNQLIIKLERILYD
ncbi:hypothetical protein EJK17_00565 [Lactobacillus xujianguonis]|uniref:Uncharacterized protein n=1 Tax=Lactobacillus xujianguonis TaxID=2495899 RepID=A0A437SY84_9LACO|nr:hypothetical protein [Lactobacillus xujianguonis]RVU71800.1 hypothetical protein EJK17_00565 [Lactobacillus xujianguonis]